jgi:hypothetical protein
MLPVIIDDNGNKVKRKNELANAWADWIPNLPVKFVWFATLTFKNLVHPEKANKIFRVFINKLNREIYGCHYNNNPLKGVVWVRGMERQSQWSRGQHQPGRGAIHYHVLIACVTEDIRRLKYMDLWRDLAGFAKIETPKNVGGVSVYLSKHAYAFKDGSVDIGGCIARLRDSQKSLIS